MHTTTPVKDAIRQGAISAAIKIYTLCYWQRYHKIESGRVLVTATTQSPSRFAVRSLIILGADHALDRIMWAEVTAYAIK